MPEFLCNQVAGDYIYIKTAPVNFAKFFRRSSFEENLHAAAFGNAFF